MVSTMPTQHKSLDLNQNLVLVKGILSLKTPLEHLRRGRLLMISSIQWFFFAKITLRRLFFKFLQRVFPNIWEIP